MNIRFGCAVILALASSARAQKTILLDLRISDPVLRPGELQKFEVWTTIAPPPGTKVWVGGSINTLCSVHGLGKMWADVNGIEALGTGTWSSLVANPQIVATSAGTPHPDGSLRDVFAGQFIESLVLQDETLWISSGHWTPNDYRPRSITAIIEPAAESLPHGPQQWALLYCPGWPVFVFQAWNPIRTIVSFEVRPACDADCDADEDLDIFDFLCFQTEFASHTTYADCEADGDWDVFDFLCYQQLFYNGCG